MAASGEPNSLLLRSSPTLLLATGIAVGVAAASIWNSYRWTQNDSAAANKQNDDTSLSSTKKHASSSLSKNISSFPLELRQEQLSRHTLFFGEDGMKKLKEAKICVVGAGGVGSHTVCSLVRAGVGFIRVIDFDQVSLSSLNRHACATLADVGISKVTCLERFAKQLCPDSNYLTIEARACMYTAETGVELLMLPNEDGGKRNEWDLIIDAIDDVPTKAQLVYDAWQRGVRCISCMGAGGKADFTRLHVSDLKSASRDPLASKLRQCLKKLLKQHGGRTTDSSNKNQEQATMNVGDDDLLLEDAARLAIVFSSEQSIQKLADLTDEQKQGGSVSEYGAIQGMRVRVLPVLGTMPAIMGQALAGWSLAELAGHPFTPVTGERLGRNVRHKLFQKLQTREERYLQRVLEKHGLMIDETQVQRYKSEGGLVPSNNNYSNNTWIGPLQIDMDDVEYLLQIWKNRCSATAQRLGTVLHLVRWDSSKPSTCDNLIILAQSVKEHWDRDDENGNDPRDRLPVQVRSNIEARLATCNLDAKA